jgi:hypothetical protein
LAKGSLKREREKRRKKMKDVKERETRDKNEIHKKREDDRKMERHGKVALQ